MESLPANLFPGAAADAPDLHDIEQPNAPASAGFPAAPAPSAFGNAPAEASFRPLTTIERALAFLQEKGPVTREDLCDHLGVRRDALSAYIGNAVKDGRIELTKTMAKLGTGKVLPPVAKPPRDKQPAPPAPPPTVEKEDPRKVSAISASLKVGDLQLVAWADGAFGVHVRDQAVVLSAAQLQALTIFLNLAEACAE